MEKEKDFGKWCQEATRIVKEMIEILKEINEIMNENKNKNERRY